MGRALVLYRVRQLLAWLAGLAVVLGLGGAGVAALGRVYWGDAGWYYHTGPDYRLRCGQKAVQQADWDRADQVALLLEADGHKDHAALLRGEALFRQARRHADANQLPTANPLLLRALAEFAKIRDQETLRVEAAALVGQCYVYLRQPAEAERAFRFALSRQPDQVDAHRGLAVIYFDQGALRRAVEHLEKVAALDPRDGRPHRLMGLIYKDLNEFPQAAACYDEALRRELRGQDPATVRREQMECLVKLKAYGPALELAEQLKPPPQNRGPVAALRAECLRGLGRSAEAQAVLDQALQASPACPELCRLRAQLHLEANEAAAAVALFQRALAVDQHDFASRHLLAQAYERLGRPAEAAEQRRLMEEDQKGFLELSRLNEDATARPFDRDLRLKLAALCARLDRPGEAEMWRRAAAACPSTSAAAGATPPGATPAGNARIR